MRIKQALVAVGGKATRLRRGGVEVPISKAFLNVADRPLLYWSLSNLYVAGIREVVIVGELEDYIEEAARVISSLPYTFAEVEYFQDLGLGAHGLPYHVRHLLDEEFIFECGHAIAKPEHYRRLGALKDRNSVVFSAFAASRVNHRQPVKIIEDSVKLASKWSSDCYSLAHPFVVDQEYAMRLPQLHFDITKIIDYYSGALRLKYAVSDMPPEFDVAQEMSLAQKVYEQYLSTISRQ